MKIILEDIMKCNVYCIVDNDNIMSTSKSMIVYNVF